jgi:hypothetical protein
MVEHKMTLTEICERLEKLAKAKHMDAYSAEACSRAARLLQEVRVRIDAALPAVETVELLEALLIDSGES